MDKDETTNQDMQKLEESIKSLGVLPDFDQNILFALERKYFDFIDLRDFELVTTDVKVDLNKDLKLIKVTSVNHLEKSDIGLHLQNFSNLLAVMKDPHHTLFSIIKGSSSATELYYGIVNNYKDKDKDTQKKTEVETNSYFNENFLAAIRSNFPAMSYEIIDSELRKSAIDKKLLKYSNIDAITGIPTLRVKNTREENFQGIDRFIQGMQGSDYMLLVIAEPIPLKIINSMISKLYSLSSEFHSYVKQTIMKTKGTSDTVSVGANFNLLSSVSDTVTKSTTRNSGSFIGSLIGGTLGFVTFGPPGAFLGAGLGSSIGTLTGSKTKGSAKTETNGSSLGLSLGYAKSWLRSTSLSVETYNKKAEYAKDVCENYIKRLQSGKNNGFWNVGVYMLSNDPYKQYKGTSLLSSVISGDETHYEPIRSVSLNKDVTEKYLQYFINPNYKKLLYGDEEHFKTRLKNEVLINKYWESKKKDIPVENLKLEFIKKNEEDQTQILTEINRFADNDLKNQIESEINQIWQELEESQSAHPLGSIMGGVSTPLNTEELAIIMNLPRKEINGVPVLQKAEFGRNIRTYHDIKGETIDIGELRYLGKGEKNRLCLNLESLRSHTFITGSTGSGKSNTVFNILDKLSDTGVKYLVIEPVKGEYKHVFGRRKEVGVYGTNFEHTELLRINPFKFPKEIHVLEHLDRLTEIFNATWPMYAAMPALLKEAMEKVYFIKGWDLESSICLKEKPEYPTVMDLLRVMPSIIEQSGYSLEVKSNYYGALVSRLKSLTNGLYRQILTEEEVDNKELFDQNCIIDISRIGSMETKSLLMGIIFMKMYEYRISAVKEFNTGLKHVTVMEEAHHLMRKTSFDQNEEYSNIQGKAVEMITNSLAEMRTYGEGFILVDQAPTLLDLTAIRNTNTKIILRLPDQSDKEVVGFATNLNDSQIRELSRLETGEAVVYQNDWLQAVTGMVDKYQRDESLKYEHDYSIQKKLKTTYHNELLKILINPFVSEANKIELPDTDIDKLSNWLNGQPINNKVRSIVKEILALREEHSIFKERKFARLADIVDSIFRVEDIALLESEADTVEKWNEKLIGLFCKKGFVFPNEEFKIEFLHLLLCSYAHKRKTERINQFYFSWVEKTTKRG